MTHQIEIARDGVASSTTPIAVGQAGKVNGCLSALSSHAFSLLKSYLVEVVLREGTILWDANKLSSDVYFPISGLVSILIDASDGFSVEVGSICSQAAVGAIFELDQSYFSTKVWCKSEVVSFACLAPNYYWRPKKTAKSKISLLIAATGSSCRHNRPRPATRYTRPISDFVDGSFRLVSGWTVTPFI
jgi:hypothetical protein